MVVAFPHVSFYRFGVADETPFCDQPLNSTGFPGLLSMEGCDSLTGRMLTLHSAGGQEQRPGSTWSFQILYRDASSPLAGFNLTNAVSVRWTP